MEHITSRHNPLMGHIRRLAGSAAYRWETGEFLCDSPKLLQEALLWQAEITAVVTISPLPQLPEHIRQVQVPEDVMASISPVKTPQGVLFTCRLPQAPLPRSLTGRRYVLLDGVQDPGNVGTILRTLDAFDADGLLLTGGTTGAVQDAAYQTFLDKIEPYSFNAVGCDTKNSTVKGLFANWTRRLRDEQGVKFQCVLHGYPAADYEGVISVKNGLVGASDDPSAVYWTTGAESACAINRSMTNSTYTGEYDIDTNYTQTQLEKAIKAGEFTFHRVGDQTRVLTDINTFVSVTDEKSADFSSNQVMRVLDQIANDIASLFNSKYLGKVQNDASGRVSLWSDIVAHHTQLQTIRAIENFDSSNVTVSQGDMKKSVAVEDHVQPVSAMEQLYMKVIVE